MQTLEQIVKQALQEALAITHGNIRAASQLLDISPTTFYRKCKKLRITIPPLAVRGYRQFKENKEPVHDS